MRDNKSLKNKKGGKKIMEFRKEKNLIYLTVENQQYIYNIATNQLVNSKRPNTTLTTVKRFGGYYNRLSNSLLASAMSELAERNLNWLENNCYYQTLCLVEKIENICSSHNITIRIGYRLDAQSLGSFLLMQNNTTLFNYFISQITKYANQSIDWSSTQAKIIKDYQYTQYEKLWTDIDLSMFNEVEQRDIRNNLIYLYTISPSIQHEQKDEYFSVYKYYYSKFIIPTLLARKENINSIDIKDMILQYLEFCRKINKTPQKTTNFLREYCETLNSYRLNKKQYDLERLQKIYQSHKTALEFCYGDFMVVVPQKPQDFVKEGEEMHHCVGGYINRVLTEQCYIVFVRHKNSPDKCYITAEIRPDGSLGQYYLAYDRTITSQEDKEFYCAFQRHLNKYWNN